MNVNPADRPAAHPTAARTGNPLVCFVLGGARSGKSAWAEAETMASGLAPIYVATCEPGDEEMAERVRRHRDRRGSGWTTAEAPLDLVAAIEAQAGPGRALLVDCLTLWLSNLMAAGRDPEAEGERLAACLAEVAGPVVVVSNEVGHGIVPDNAAARAFRDAAGRLHQTVAAAAGRVILVSAGLPLILKDLRL